MPAMLMIDSTVLSSKQTPREYETRSIQAQNDDRGTTNSVGTLNAGSNHNSNQYSGRAWPVKVSKSSGKLTSKGGYSSNLAENITIRFKHKKGIEEITN